MSLGRNFARGEIEPTQDQIELNKEKLRKLGKTSIFYFEWSEPLVAIFDYVEW